MSKTFDQESSASLARKEALARDRQAQEQRRAEAAQRAEQLQRAQEYIERLNAQLQHMQERIEALHARVEPLTSPPAAAAPVPPVIRPQPPQPSTVEPAAVAPTAGPGRPWPWLAAGVLLGCVVGGSAVWMRLGQPKAPARQTTIALPSPRPAMTPTAPIARPAAAKPAETKPASAPRARRAASPSLLPSGSSIQEWTPPRESLVTVSPEQPSAAPPPASSPPTQSPEPILIEPRRGPFRI